MKKPFITLAAIVSLGGFASIAAAQDTATTGSTNAPALTQEGQTGQDTGMAGIPSGQQLTQAECEQLWSTAAGSSETLSESEAEDFTENFSLVDRNSDGQISQSEFLEGCEQGWVQRLAATGETGADPTMPESSTN